MTLRFIAMACAAAALGMTAAPQERTAQAPPLRQGASAADAVTAEARRYFEAVRRSDVTVLESLLAQDYVEVSPLGQVDTRAQVIRFYQVAAKAQTGQASEVTDVVIDELAVRVFGDVAVAIVGESFTLTVAGSPVARPMRSTLVWHRTGGVWKLVSSHHSAVRPPIGQGNTTDR